MPFKHELVVNGEPVLVEFKLIGKRGQKKPKDDPAQWQIIAGGVQRGVITRNDHKRFTAKSERDGLEYGGDTLILAASALIYKEDKEEN